MGAFGSSGAAASAPAANVKQALVLLCVEQSDAAASDRTDGCESRTGTSKDVCTQLVPRDDTSYQPESICKVVYHQQALRRQRQEQLRLWLKRQQPLLNVNEWSIKQTSR